MSDDHAQIHELLANYALALDAGDTDGCLELFAEDAEFVVYGRAFAGRAGVGKMFRDAPRGLHMTGASRVDVNGDTATARTQVLFVRAGDLHLRPALYDDELVRHGDQWLFGRRRCRFVTAHGLSDAPEVP
jgi:uncharacterized protein (TIGR02246 family)